MKNRIASFFKKEFFEFDSTFLSTKLEDRLKYHKVISELFLHLRKRIAFYLISFSIFCLFLGNVPRILQILGQSFLTSHNQWRFFGLTSLSIGTFFTVFYLMQLMRSQLLRDLDFFIIRIQVAGRYTSHPYTQFNHENLNTPDLLKFFLAMLSIIPMSIMYYNLAKFLAGWIVLPIFLHVLTFFSIWLLHQKNTHFLLKTNEHYQKDVRFFLSIGKFLKQIKTLAFDTIIKKQILSFSENNSFLYQKIFENNVIISGIKYCIVFLIFALNSVLFFSVTQTQEFLPFLSVLFISFVLSYCFLNTLNVFSAQEGAQEFFKLFKNIDAINAQQKLKEPTDLEEDNQNVVSFENASFVKDNQVVFHQMNQHLKKNIMVCIIGSTQYERSNYLSACVGHLQQIGGKFYYPEHYEFLPKQTIIFDGTIRENIIGSNEYSHQYYQDVLEACALKNELDCLPINDLTKVNSNELKFSTSFLKKIGIARIVYAKSAVNFFDDPFSDLSQQDVTKIFFEAFQKLLAGTTRIFATDRTEYAALSDDIVLCRGGKIIEQGAHVSLLALNGAYARLFYAGAENKRFEILQTHQKQETSVLYSPVKQHSLTANGSKTSEFSFVFFEKILENFQQRINNTSYFFKMFFPVFVSKNFYAFFTFLTLSIWASVYSFYFIFENLTFNSISKLSILFMCFSIITCTAFTVMLIFYKNFYATCAYIIENVARLYFARFFTKAQHFEQIGLSESQESLNIEKIDQNFDWRKKHILSVTGHFYVQLLNFLILSFFCLAFIIFLATIATKTFIFSFLCISILALFVHTFIQTKLFYDDESSRQMRAEFRAISAQFFSAYNEPQSKTTCHLLLERVHAKLYGLYFLDFSFASKKTSLFKIFGIQNLWQNYRIIESMIVAVKLDQNGFKPRSLPALWPEHGLIQIQNVKFNSDYEQPVNITIPVCARFMYTQKIQTKTSLFIEKIRLLSPVVCGEIKIDGEDISLFSASDIRRCIGYISANSYVPFISIREHLDPYQHHDDVDIWEILNRVGLSQHVALLKYGLSTKMEHVPQEMFWSGETLLFSLARCILNANKIICVDYLEVSDDVLNKICQLIQTECKDSTIIFAGSNDKFKNVCTMCYSEYEENENNYSLKSEERSVVNSNSDESEIRFPIV